MDIKDNQDDGTVTINGITFSYEVFESLAKPNPTVAYQFNRRGDAVIVHQIMPCAECSSKFKALRARVTEPA